MVAKPNDEPLTREELYGTTQEQFWKLVAFAARHEPGRAEHYDELARVAKERRLREMREAAARLPRDSSRLTLEETLDRLEGVRSNGRGKWRARCPIHGSEGGTLLVSEDRIHPGEPSIHCFAGCDFVEIVRYLKSCR